MIFMSKRAIAKIAAIAASVTLVFSLLLLTNPTPALADGETAASIAELQKQLAADMTDRDTAFTLHYSGDPGQVIPSIKDIFLQTVRSDDNLSLAWKEMRYTYSSSSLGLDIHFTLSYHTTKEEEDYVDAAVEKIVGQLVTSKMSDISKETAIHKWIVENVKYDYSLKQITAYTALKDRRTTCMGYAILMDKMLQQAGVESKIITGNYPEGYHAWNMVKINSKWYHLDVTDDWALGEKLPQNKTESEMISANYTWDKTQS